MGSEVPRPWITLPQWDLNHRTKFWESRVISPQPSQQFLREKEKNQEFIDSIEGKYRQAPKINTFWSLCNISYNYVFLKYYIIRLRARRVLTLINAVLLRTRRALSPYILLFSDNTLLVFKGTSLNSINVLLALNCQYYSSKNDNNSKIHFLVRK